MDELAYTWPYQMEMKTETQSLEEAVVLERPLSCMNWFGYLCSKFLVSILGILGPGDILVT